MTPEEAEIARENAKKNRGKPKPTPAQKEVARDVENEKMRGTHSPDRFQFVETVSHRGVAIIVDCAAQVDALLMAQLLMAQLLMAQLLMTLTHTPSNTVRTQIHYGNGTSEQHERFGKTSTDYGGFKETPSPPKPFKPALYGSQWEA